MQLYLIFIGTHGSKAIPQLTQIWTRQVEKNPQKFEIIFFKFISLRLCFCLHEKLLFIPFVFVMWKLWSMILFYGQF